MQQFGQMNLLKQESADDATLNQVLNFIDPSDKGMTDSFAAIAYIFIII